MTYKTIDVEKDEGVTTITLNRPTKKNCMNPQLTQDMVDVLEELRYDKGTRVIVITGAGNAFCAGMDLKEYFDDLKNDPDEFDRVSRLAIEWRGRTLRAYPKPTLAMINGYCFGGAFSIVEGCDLAIAANEATFGLSEINFRHFPGGAVSKSLANLLRPRDALWYAMLGRPFNGNTAASIGLVNLSVPLARLHEETYAVARELAAKDPQGLHATKDAYRLSLEMTWDTAINYAMTRQVALKYTQNNIWMDEGIGDFLKGKYRPGLGSHEQQAD